MSMPVAGALLLLAGFVFFWLPGEAVQRIGKRAEASGDEQTLDRLRNWGTTISVCCVLAFIASFAGIYYLRATG